MVSLVAASKFVCELSDFLILQNSRKPSFNQKLELSSTIKPLMPPTFSIPDMILINMLQLFAALESFAFQLPDVTF